MAGVARRGLTLLAASRRLIPHSLSGSLGTEEPALQLCQHRRDTRFSSNSSRQSKLKGQAVHLFQCHDQLGVVAKISECVASKGANILDVDLHIDFSATGDDATYYGRSEFVFDPAVWPRHEMEADFQQIARQFGASKSIIRVVGHDPRHKVALLVSYQDHCLIDLLYRWQEGALPVDITCVISNHDRSADTHIRRFLQRHKIPFHFLPTRPGDKREAEILDLVKGDTDFLVLARYMQVLSPTFLQEYQKDIINIHHGLLPSFKGANPYRQAYQAGVKLIGATSHFVTEQLDNGPIIEQLVDRVSHQDTLSVFAAKSKNLEKQCLANAVKNYCEHRILQYSGNKTIVFS